MSLFKSFRFKVPKNVSPPRNICGLNTRFLGHSKHATSAFDWSKELPEYQTELQISEFVKFRS
jgi:hypothetical protein